MNKTAIEYLTHTYNPIAMRCTPVSEGCENCWHLRTCRRFAKNPNFTPEVRAAYAGGSPVLVADRLEAPLRRWKRAVVGVQFMGDLFYQTIAFEFIAAVYGVMQATRHTYVLLTKRPERAVQFFAWMKAYASPEDRYGRWQGEAHLAARLAHVKLPNRPNIFMGHGAWPPPNVWLLTTIEHPDYLWRATELMKCPAVIRGVSIEPMLGPINIAPYLGQVHADSLGLPYKGDDPWYDGLDWVICGAETGARKRPMKMGWARHLRDQCVAAGAPFFFKRDSNGSRLLDGRKWEQYPERNK